MGLTKKLTDRRRHKRSITASVNPIVEHWHGAAALSTCYTLFGAVAACSRPVVHALLKDGPAVIQPQP